MSNLNSNIWEIGKVCCEKVYFRKYADAEVGRIRYLKSENVYSATIIEFDQEMIMETTKFFDIFLEAILWIDAMVEIIFEIPV